MSATADAGLRDRLRVVEREISDLKSQRVEKAGEAERRKREWMESGEDIKQRGPLYRAAMRAGQDVQQLDEQLDDARKAQISVLELISGGGLGGAEVGDTDGVDRRAVDRLKATPGAWLSAALD